MQGASSRGLEEASATLPQPTIDLLWSLYVVHTYALWCNTHAGDHFHDLRPDVPDVPMKTM